MSVIFSEFEQLTQSGLSPLLHLLMARPRRQGHHGYRIVLAAGQPQPATAEELTRDLAGWSLPQAAPLGRASASWLW